MKRILSLASLIFITSFIAKAQCNLVVDSTTNLLCNNNCSIGKIAVSTTGGVSPYNYLLMPGNISNTTGIFNNVCAGSYYITSTDATNCSTASIVNIYSPPPLVSTETHTTSSCVPGCDGIINITPSGGLPPYSFITFPSIVSSPSPGNYINVCQNTYTIQTIDANGCNFSTPINNSPQTFLYPVYQPYGSPGILVNCNYQCMGTIALATNFLTSISSYTITSIPPSVQVGNLIGGFCGITDLFSNPVSITTSLTDTFGCIYIFNYILNAGIMNGIGGLNLNTNPTIINPTCATSCDGSIVPNPIGGVPPYIVSITGGVFNNLCNGTYTLSVTDSLNCTKDSIITLQGPAQIPIAINPIAPSICPNTSTTLSASGANTYIWQPGNIATSSISVSPINNTVYTVTAIGNAACTGSNTVTVSILPTPIISYNILPSPTICFGDSITITASGASIYNWSNSIVNGMPFVPSSSSTYNVIATDSAGCSANGSVSIIVNPNIITPNCTLTSSPSPIIIGQSNIITANIPLPITSYSIMWFVNNNLYSNSTNPNNSLSFSPTSLNDTMYAKIIPTGACYIPDTIITNTIFATAILGTDDASEISKISINPNPASSEIVITASIDFSQMSIYDSQMSTIENISFPKTKEKKISIASLSNGIYFIKTNNSGVKKIIIQR